MVKNMVEYKAYRGCALRIVVRMAMLVLLLTGGAKAAILTVCPDSCVYTSIQTAINVANPGDTIEVRSGIYYENVNVNKKLILLGVGYPVVNAGGSGNAITLSAGSITFEGFIVTNATNGIYINSSDNIVKSNNATTNTNSGIEIFSKPDWDIGTDLQCKADSNTLIDNIVSNNSIGFYLSNYYYKGLCSSYNNALVGNKALYNSDWGIYIENMRSGVVHSSETYVAEAHNNISYNIVSNNGNGIYLHSGNNILTGNNVSNNTNNGVSLDSTIGIIMVGPLGSYMGDAAGVGDNTLSNNTISNNGNGIYVYNSTDNTLKGNSILSNNNGIILNNSDSNLIHNNYFKNINNANDSGNNFWNTTKTSGINIVGGSYLGGNFWANPSGTGFSQTCINTDGDGICDSPYVLDADNTDYLPLSLNNQPSGEPAITSFAPLSSTISDYTGANRSFNITVNQTVNVTWYINGSEVQSNKSVTDARYTNTSAAQGIWIVKATATNINGTVSKEWTWNVTSPLIIAINSPSNNSENITGDVRVTVNLNREGTALLNWNGVNESMDGARRSFSRNKTGLLTGTYSFRIYANDSSGISNVSKTLSITINKTKSIALPINESTFIVKDAIKITSASSNVTVTISNGTNASINGSYLPSISIDSLADIDPTFVFNLSSSDKLIGENLSLSPAGAIFSPNIQIRFNYTDPQLTAAGISESDISVKYYNSTKNNWEALPIYERNTTGNYLIVNASHFSIFALIGTTATATYSSSGGGGSGGGGGGSSGENYTNIDVIEKYDQQISKDALTSYRFTSSKNPILFINITGNTSLGIITASIEALKGTSSLVKVPPEGLVYKNVNIWVGTSGFATPKNIKEALIKFRIDNEWMSANGVSASDIVLMKWDGTRWIKLETNVLSKDDTSTNFEGKTNTFSPFVITQLKESVPQVTPQATAQSVISAKVTDTTPAETTSEGARPLNFGIIIAMFAIIGIVIAVYAKMRGNFKK